MARIIILFLIRTTATARIPRVYVTKYKIKKYYIIYVCPQSDANTAGHIEKQNHWMISPDKTCIELTFCRDEEATAEIGNYLRIIF